MTQRTYQAAVLGSPITHSKSPQMHQAVYDYLGVPISYGRIDVTEAQIDAFMATLPERFNSVSQIAGFSVTMPLKAALVGHMTKVSQRVRNLGVLNTVVFDEQGQAHGYNTDVDGIRLALTTAGQTPPGGSMGILGAGGTASAAVAAAADLGLQRVVLYVRNANRAQDTVTVAQRFGLSVEVESLAAFGPQVPQHAAVVATLPAYAADALVDQLPTGVPFPPLLDVIYDPWPTSLAAAWQTTGAAVVSGLHMLLYQGVAQARLFTQRLIADPQAVDWEAATDIMAQALDLALD